MTEESNNMDEFEAPELLEDWMYEAKDILQYFVGYIEDSGEWKYDDLGDGLDSVYCGICAASFIGSEIIVRQHKPDCKLAEMLNKARKLI